jgi:hypothetical protein
VFKRAKTVPASDRAAAVIGFNFIFLTPVPDSDIFKAPKMLVTISVSPT